MEYREVINRISCIRNKQNISARDLSLRLGKSSNYITKAECMDFKLTIDMIFEILDIFGMTPEEFFYHDLNDYRTDIGLLQTFNKLNKDQKGSLKEFLELL